ncbi:hypothetical protein A9Q62_14525 [Yersinia ruckeri]|nr:hypothetical protein NJ56_03575 [Yersinia ruckeri]OJB84729.1 hypothetical protein A9Q62_14525 [Yersinia ruckeri]OJB91152.1 hypothetical protein A9Q60_14155 [Yersinia ruckeri]
MDFLKGSGSASSDVGTADICGCLFFRWNRAFETIYLNSHNYSKLMRENTENKALRVIGGRHLN